MVLHIQVKPQSKKDEVSIASDGSIVVRIKAAPVDGKANAYLIKFLADFFDASASKIILLKGTGNRHKKIEVSENEKFIIEKLNTLQNR